MSLFRVTLKNGSQVNVNAADEKAALAHAKAVADAHRVATEVGPDFTETGGPNRPERAADHQRADAEQPVSAKLIKS